MPNLSFAVSADYSQVERLRKEIESLEGTLRSFKPGTAQTEIAAVTGQLQTARNEFRQITRTAAEAGAKIEMGVQKGVNGAISQIHDLQSQISKNPLQLAVQIAGLSALGGLLNDLMKTRSEFQLMETNINTLVGERKGAILNAQLKEFAKVSPLDFQGTVRGAQQMLGFGIEAEKVPKFLAAIGDVSMGDAQKFSSLTLAFSQMSAAGKLMGQDLMQMVNAGFQPLDQMAKDTGKSIGQLKEEMSKGKISAEMVQQAFINATSEGGKYYQMSAKATQTLGGQLSMLEDATSLMFNEMGEASEGVMMKIIEWATWIIEHWKKVGVAVAGGIAAFGAFKATKMALDFAEKKSAEEKTQAVIDGFNKQMAAMEQYEAAKRANAAADAATDGNADFSSVQRPDEAIKKLEKGVALSDDELQQITAYSTQIEQLRVKKEKQDEVNRGLQEELDKLRQINAERNSEVETPEIKPTVPAVPESKFDADLQKKLDGGADEAVIEQIQKEREFIRFKSDYTKMELDDQKKKVGILQEQYDKQKEIYEQRKKDHEQAMDDFLNSTDDDSGAALYSADSDDGITLTQEMADALDKLNESKAKLAESSEALKNAQTEEKDLLSEYENLQEKVNEINESAADAKEEQVSAAEGETSATNVNTASAEANAAAQGANTVAAEAGAAANNADAVATGANTAAKTTNTGAVAANTGANVANRVSVDADAAAKTRNTAVTKLWTATQKIGAAASKAFRAQLDALKTAWNTNPIGIIASALLTLGGVIASFWVGNDDDAEKATGDLAKYGEEAHKTQANVEELYAVVGSTNKNSQVHKDAVDQLAKQAKEYGIILDEEKDKLEQLLALRQQMIAAIQEEGRQRQIANAIAANQESIAEAEKEFDEDMIDNIEDENSDATGKRAKTLNNLIKASIAENREALTKYYEELQAMQDAYLDNIDVNGHIKDKNKEKELTSQIADMQNKIAQMGNKEAKDFAKSMGLDYKIDIKDFVADMKKYIDALNEGRMANESLTNAQKASEAAAESAKPDKLTDWSSESSDKVIKQIEKAGKALDELSKKKVKPTVDTLEIKDAEDKAKDAKKSVGELDNATAKPTIDSSSAEKAGEKIADVESKAQEIDMISATPYINTQYIDVALSKMGTLANEFAKLDGNRLEFYNMTDSQRAWLQLYKTRYGTLDSSQWDSVRAKQAANAQNDEQRAKWSPEQLQRDIADMARITKNIIAQSKYELNGKTYNLTPELSAIKMGLDATKIVTKNGKKYLYAGQGGYKSFKEYNDAKNFLDRSVALTATQRGEQDVDYLMKAYNKSIDDANSDEALGTLIKELSAASGKAEYKSYAKKKLETLLKKAKKKKEDNSGNKKKNGKSKEELDFEFNRAIEEESRRQSKLKRDAEYDDEQLRISKISNKHIRSVAEAEFEWRKKNDSIQDEIDEEARKLRQEAYKEWKIKQEKAGKKGDQIKEHVFEKSITKEQREEWRKLAEINVNADSNREQSNFDREQKMVELIKERNQSYVNYLKAFENINAKMIAMERDYTAQLEQAEKDGNPFEIARIKAERNNQREQLKSEKLMADLDFDTIFSDVSQYTDTYLDTLRNKLMGVLNDNSLDIRLEDKNRILEKLQEIDGQIAIRVEDKRNEEWFSGMRSSGQGLWSIAKTIEDEAKRKRNIQLAEGTLATNQKAQTEADAALANIDGEIRELASKLGVAVEEINDEAIKNIQSKMEDTTQSDLDNAQERIKQIGLNSGMQVGELTDDDFKSVIGRVRERVGGSDELNAAVDAYNAASNAVDAGKTGFMELMDKRGKAKTTAAAAEKKTQQAEKNVEDSKKDGGAAASFGVADAVVHGINQNMQSMIQLMDELQLSDTEFGKGMKSFAESSQYATKAFDSLKSGDFVGVVSNLHGALRTLGDALGQWGIGGGLFGSSFIEFEDELAKLTRSVDMLRKSNELLLKEYENASIAKASQVNKQEMENIKQATAGTKELFLKGAKTYSNGFIGIGGKSSSAKEVSKRLDELNGTTVLRTGLNAISKITGENVTAENFFSYLMRLTPEQMAEMVRYAPNLMAEIKDALSKGDKDVSELFEQYLSYAGQCEEATKRWQEAVTATTFDGILGEFKSMLGDINNSAADFADNFEKMMQNAVINGLVNEKYKERIQKWYDDFAKKMESGGGLSPAEQEKLRDEYNNIVAQGIAERDAIFDTFGWDGSSSQKAAGRGVQSMSEDTGNAIEGRMTAIQLSVESIRKSESSQATSLAAVNNAIIQSMAERNQYREFYIGMENKIARICTEVQCINENTALMAKLMAPMQKDMEQIKLNTKRI